MNNLTALSLSIGALSGVATFLAVGPTAGLFLIWAATIAWAAYFALGANKAASQNVVVCGAYGVFLAWVAFILITHIPASAGAFGFAVLASLAVAVSVVVLCLGANLPQLSAIPASVLGYSSTCAYVLQTPDKLNQDFLLHLTWQNPLILVSASIAIGVAFAVGSVQLSAKIQEVANKK
jgi:hypothetical protein